MEVKETQTSLESQFYSLLKEHCPNLVIGSNPVFGRMSNVTSGYLWFWTKPRLFQKSSCVLSIIPVLRIRPPDAPYREPFHKLFVDAVWEDLEFEIYDSLYFDKIKLFADAYEKLSEKKVTIFKIF